MPEPIAHYLFKGKGGLDFREWSLNGSTEAIQLSLD